MVGWRQQLGQGVVRVVVVVVRAVGANLSEITTDEELAAILRYEVIVFSWI